MSFPSRDEPNNPLDAQPIPDAQQCQDSGYGWRGPASDPVKSALASLEDCLIQMNDDWREDGLEEIVSNLRRLHAGLRSRHAAGILAEDQSALLPELVEERTRLREEIIHLIGQLDRILRTADSILMNADDDIDLFMLRVREMGATVRRHEAEEDRLLFRSGWDDIGGES